MTKTRFFAVAAMLASVIATPALARDVNKNAMTRDTQTSDNSWDRRADTGFWPADAAAGIVGGAIGTAGAIATAPLRAGDAYAYDNGPYDPRFSQSYAARNGFVCEPGTYFRGEDGRRHLCQ